MTGGDWACEAYGAEGAGVGALCFAAAPGRRVCDSQQVCARVMGAERQRVFDRIQELAARGDPDAQYLAGEFPSPEGLLGGNPES